MADLNKQSLEMWNAMKPMVDREIDQQTKGAVQRRKAKVTTAPSLVTKKIGVTEPFGDQYFIPYDAKVAGANVGDVVWVEYMYGASNAFASMFAKAVEDPRLCSAALSSAGWYRAVIYKAYDSYSAQGTSGEIVDINIVRTATNNCGHHIKLFLDYGKVAFLGEESNGTYNIVDKIRYTYSGSVGYIDIHFVGVSSGSVPVHFAFDVTTRTYANSYWVAGTLASVADAPSGETVLTTHTFAATSKTPVEYGTANGWDYVLYADKTIEATRTISQTLSYYTTVGGLYGYYISDIALPFTMANNNYYVGTTWSIGSGFSIAAGLLSVTTTKFNAYALATAGGTSENVDLYLLLKGKIA